jgi:hypothetical protein
MTIEEICKQYNILNYTINSDGSIDVDGDVWIASWSRNKNEINKLPLKFNKVTGNFSCTWNKLTSLDGAPNYVDGHFSCNHNQLTSLEGCPKEVGGYFDCNNNQLTSLDGCPNYVGGNFHCFGNPLPQEIIDNPETELKRLNREKKLNYLLNET